MASRLILLGPPGAGKGTQAIKVAEFFKVPHISTGDIMRAELASGSALGQEAKRYMDAGELVPDSVVLGIIEQRFKSPDCQAGFLLDGFPRTVAQAEGLNSILSKSKQALTAVVNLKVADSIVVERILKRGIASGRSDDTAEVIQKRLDVFQAQTAPLIQFYGNSGHLVEIDGVGEVEEVFNRVLGAIKQKEAN